MSRFRCLRFFPALLLLPALLAGVSAPARAEEGQPEPGGSAAPAARPESRPERVYVMNGATISWDLDRQRFHPPTAEQAARIAEELQRWISANLEGGEEPPSVKDLPVETLKGGVKKARLPLYLMNAAMVRVGSGGELAGICAEGPDLARAFAAPAVEEERR